MQKRINTLYLFLLMLSVAACSSLPKNANAGGYRIEQVTEENSLPDGVGKIIGVVKDATTGDRLEEGEIFVYSLNKRFPLKKDGSFSEIIPAGKYAVTINSEGYNPVTTSNLLVRTKTTTYLNVVLFSPGKNEGPGKTN